MTQDRLRLGLIGYPLEHSFSPRLHLAALRACGLNGEYRLYPIPPGLDRGEKLKELLDSLRRGEVKGLNVTIPLKQEIMPYLDELAPAARAIGAVNTISGGDGLLFGDNTDAPGFLADLRRLEFFREGRPSTALILGAGGAARAVIHALRQAGWQVIVAARRVEQARELVDELHAIRFTPVALRDALEAISDWRSALTLIVNTTPLGMAPWMETSPWPEALPFPEGVFVYDLVYNPAQTLFIRRARRAGLKAANGLGMLVEQAALSFERWTGLDVSRAELRNAILEFQG